MEWQNLWGTKSAGTKSKEMDKVVMGVLISHRTSIMKKIPKEEDLCMNAKSPRKAKINLYASAASNSSYLSLFLKYLGYD